MRGVTAICHYSVKRDSSRHECKVSVFANWWMQCWVILWSVSECIIRLIVKFFLSEAPTPYSGLDQRSRELPEPPPVYRTLGTEQQEDSTSTTIGNMKKDWKTYIRPGTEIIAVAPTDWRAFIPYFKYLLDAKFVFAWCQNGRRPTRDWIKVVASDQRQLQSTLHLTLRKRAQPVHLTVIWKKVAKTLN